jgi:hypothetical protein
VQENNARTAAHLPVTNGGAVFGGYRICCVCFIFISHKYPLFIILFMYSPFYFCVKLEFMYFKIKRIGLLSAE